MERKKECAAEEEAKASGGREEEAVRVWCGKWRMSLILCRCRGGKVAMLWRKADSKKV